MRPPHCGGLGNADFEVMNSKLKKENANHITNGTFTRRAGGGKRGAAGPCQGGGKPGSRGCGRLGGGKAGGGSGGGGIGAVVEELGSSLYIFNSSGIIMHYTFFVDDTGDLPWQETSKCPTSSYLVLLIIIA